MAYTLDAMISVFQKAAEVCRDFSPNGSTLFPSISAIHFDNDDEFECFYIAVQRKHIKTYTGNTGQQSFSLEDEGKIELCHLLEKREALRREKQLLRHSRGVFIVAVMTFISSVIYLSVTVWILYNPVRPDVYNTITVPGSIREYHQCEIPRKKQDRNCYQRNDKR